MFAWRYSSNNSTQTLSPPVDLVHVASNHDASDTRRPAQLDLFAGIGEATETNLAVHMILREAVALVDDMTACSDEFEDTAVATHRRAESFVSSVSQLQDQSHLIDDRLRSASDAVEQARQRSRSALASVEDLRTSIGEIEKVVGTIARIASQINPLALAALAQNVYARAGRLQALGGTVRTRA